jgi:SAM-dependent methyltransferase
MSRLAALLDLPARDILRLLRRRLPGARTPWTVDELLAHSSKHRRGDRLLDAQLRWGAAARRTLGDDPLRFEGSRVLEIGCGPLGGFAPVAAFLGATSFDAVDPEFDPRLLGHARIAAEYLLPLHGELCAVHGPRMQPAEFIQRLASILRPHRETLEEARLEAPPDLVLSMSCLEHVFPVEGVPRTLARIGAARARQAHLVDYSNHSHTRSPFDGLYEVPPDAYIARRGQAINLARSPDIHAAFEAAGMPLTSAMRRAGPMPAGRAPHAWWSGRYAPEELAIHVELLVRLGA